MTVTIQCATEITVFACWPKEGDSAVQIFNKPVFAGNFWLETLLRATTQPHLGAVYDHDELALGPPVGKVA